MIVHCHCSFNLEYFLLVGIGSIHLNTIHFGPEVKIHSVLLRSGIHCCDCMVRCFIRKFELACKVVNRSIDRDSLLGSRSGGKFQAQFLRFKPGCHIVAVSIWRNLIIWECKLSVVENRKWGVFEIIKHKESATKIKDLIYTEANHVLVSDDVEVIPHLDAKLIKVREIRWEDLRVVIEQDIILEISVSICLAALKWFAWNSEWCLNFDLFYLRRCLNEL